MPKKKKVSSKELQHLGNCIKMERNNCGLSQQELAEDAHRGLRHLQNIEGGLINPSFMVLYPIVHRLAMSTDALFYENLPQVKKEVSHLLCKFAACTDDERKFLLDTVDFMVEQFICHRSENTTEENPE